MAVTENCARFLFYAKKLGVSFDHTLTLGRMILYATKEDISVLMNKYGNYAKQIDQVSFKDKYAEPLFEILGGKTVQSLDYSDYEGATIIHDLNKAVPPGLYAKYDVVFDGGTIEHVFNFPVCIESCMKLLKVGGHFIGITPCNNLTGHGFYQFSPELYYRVFSEENGFSMKKMIIASCDDKGIFENWYEVSDPKDVKERVILVNDRPTYLFVIAQKVSEKPIFQIAPYQSDYSTTWSAVQQAANGINDKSTVAGIKKMIPYSVKVVIRKIYNFLFKKSVSTSDMGRIDPLHYKKIEKR